MAILSSRVARGGEVGQPLDSPQPWRTNLIDGGGSDPAGLPAALVRIGGLDLARLGSIRAVAASELTGPRPIDLLVNNAGVMALSERRVSPDRRELQFATNVPGPFLWTRQYPA